MSHTPVRPLYAQASGSPIRAMLALAGQPGMISLAGGHPDPALLPADWLRECLLAVASGLQGHSLHIRRHRGPARAACGQRQAAAATRPAGPGRAGGDHHRLAAGD
ncbi:hypothetical protein LP415_23445 [Polaromonas sp. P1(28)-8]|nr:hypothetical protein LP415_23445 [Polaromonas sp. P1(28)-8]